MAEAISAFAAYKSNGVKSKTTGSKAKQQQKAGAARKDSPKAGAKKNTATKGLTQKNVGRPKGRRNQVQKSKPEPKPKQASKSNKRPTAGEIQTKEVDELVEELYKSPTGKKLTKAQQAKKKELEEYLVRELEKDDEEEEDPSFSDEYTLDDGGKRG